MSSTQQETKGVGRAERKFREAFERLQTNKPNILPKGTKVTQNNVAKEAGVDPSALRKSRFPTLTGEIQEWIESHRGDEARKSPQYAERARRAKNRGLRERIEALAAQRDDALSRLVEAEVRIIELTNSNARLRALLPENNVIPIRMPEDDEDAR